jgi:ABC-type glycerol-3-phosphate transport system permease component
MIVNVATAIFMTSYFFKRPATLRRIQGAGALAWLAYGVLIHARPVIVANAMVAAAAIWSSFMRPRPEPE